MCFNTYKIVFKNIRSVSRQHALALVFMGGMLAGCDSGDDSAQNTLDTYVTASVLPVSDQLIACAGGGEVDDESRPDAPISVYFYPIEGATNFRYFETASINDNPDDMSLYQEVRLDDEPFFNGYLWRFLNIPLSEERWSRVVFETGDSLHVSNAIRLKYPVKPSIYDNDRVLVQSNGVNPTFSWPDANDETDVIYFQVVSDRNGNLISGTYTFEKTFTFYDLSNVVLNIRDVSPPPMLDINTEYTFTLMTVSRDNWVNLIAQQPFSTIQ